MRAAVIGARYSAETLLSGGVPYLQFDAKSIDDNGAYLEIYADGGDVSAGECIVWEAYQQWWLANTCKRKRA